LETTLRIYQELADRYDRQREAKQRDLFLVLAADAAHAMGREEEAERLRARLLRASPHNLLRPFSSFAEALSSPDIQLYIADLKRQFPAELAERLLQAQRDQDPLGFSFGDPAPGGLEEP